MKPGETHSLQVTELDGDDVELARKASESEALPSCFESLDLARGLPEGWPSPWAVTVNPPRRGLHPRVVEGLTDRDSTAPSLAARFRRRST